MEHPLESAYGVDVIDRSRRFKPGDRTDPEKVDSTDPVNQAEGKKDIKLKLGFDVTLARGLSYYTGIIFEVKPTSVKMGNITGGGRYDDLTGIFGLAGMSGTGISFGIDRIYEVMNELELFPDTQAANTKVLVTNFGQEVLGFSLQLLNELRIAGINSEIYPNDAKMKKQFTYANKRGIPYVAVIGPDEAKEKVVTLKIMESGSQDKLQLKEVIRKLVV